MNKLTRSYNIILQFARVHLLGLWMGFSYAANLISARLYIYHFYKENRHIRISKLVWELRSSGLLHSDFFFFETACFWTSDYLIAETSDNTQHSFMPPVGFEPTISPGQRPQTYALDRAAIGRRAVVI